MIKVLVTGGAGFIGSRLCEKLLEHDNIFVVAVDNLLTGHLKKMPPPQERFRFIRGDVNNRAEIAEIMMSWKFDYVFHYAAVVGVKRTIENPLMVLKDIDGIRNILELSKNTGVQRVYYSSSSEIYGEPVEFPQFEDTTPLNSRLPYAIVKNVGEAYLKSYHREFGLDYTIFRFFNTYGAKQSKHFVISKFMSRALKNEDITIYGDGKQTRTFCYVDDNVDACIYAFKNHLFVNEVVNIGGEIEISILDLANTILKVTNSSSKVVFLPPLSEGDMRGRRPDITKMKALITKPMLSLEQGLKKIMDEGLFELKYPEQNDTDRTTSN
ncbi:MAG TPA: NAD-dependent epimerase/dehydratase family protein [Bacteroidales bacterium]|jgi:UDP-glucose 4-epimerase|nr:NAD-dependent epimerase/dehydratase family protein [Bacteroidales bacterium]